MIVDGVVTDVSIGYSATYTSLCICTPIYRRCSFSLGSNGLCASSVCFVSLHLQMTLSGVQPFGKLSDELDITVVMVNGHKRLPSPSTVELGNCPPPPHTHTRFSHSGSSIARDSSERVIRSCFSENAYLQSGGKGCCMIRKSASEKFSNGSC